MSDTELLTIPQAAAILKCSERTLRRHAASGKIEAIEVSRQGGKAWMIPKHIIERAATVAATNSDTATEARPSAALDQASAARLEHVESTLEQVKAYLAGQINTRETVREDVKLALDEALTPIAAAINALRIENERLRDQIVAERAERAAERDERPRGFWANITRSKRGQLPPGE
jgi:septal ring factor EnvC (AmiA/AmiB activator)